VKSKEYTRIIYLLIFADPKKMGFWAKNVCGGNYFFSNSLVQNLSKFKIHIQASKLGNVGGKCAQVLQFGTQADQF